MIIISLCMLNAFTSKLCQLKPSGVNTVVFDDQGEEDNDRMFVLSHPEVKCNVC